MGFTSFTSHVTLFILFMLSVSDRSFFSTATSRDDLLDAVHMADVARVQYLVVDRDAEVLSSYSPVMVNRVDPTYDRISLMVCGLDPQKRTRAETDLDCVAIAKILYNAGVNISHVDKHGWDSVAMGAVRGFDQFCEYLITQGAHHDRADEEGRTPLMKAAAHGHYDTFQLLVEKGANLSMTDNSGLTALHHATVFALQNDPQNKFLKNVTDVLLRHRSTTNSTSTDFMDRYLDKEGRTCLMYAAISNHLEVATMLMEAGADPRRVDNYGVRASSMSGDPRVRQAMAEQSVLLIEMEHNQWLKKMEGKKIKSKMKSKKNRGSKHSKD